MIELVGNEGFGARIKVVGMGGGGGNAVNTMIASGLRGVEFVVANTDAQALNTNLAPVKLQLGEKGLGAGANPDVGRTSTLEREDEIREYLQGADMVFITAGMGGGTGTGGGPVVGRIARELGALTVGVVTKPFQFEGSRRNKQAESGIRELKEAVDTLIVIPNQRLLAVANRKTSMLDCFRMADDVLLQAVRGIADLITVHGLINLDFADVRTIMAEMGMAIMGSGAAFGDNRAVEAAQKAISSPLLEDVSIQGAKGVLINITGSPDLSLHEVNEAATLIQQQAHEDAQIIFGAVIDEKMGDEIRVTVIATGFGDAAAASVAPEAPVEAPTPRVDLYPPRVEVPPLREPAMPPSSSRTSLFPRLPTLRSWQKAAAADRPVVRLGTIVDDGVEPRLQRPQPATVQEPDAFVLGDGDLLGDNEDVLDTPAFLRKQVH